LLAAYSLHVSAHVKLEPPKAREVGGHENVGQCTEGFRSK